MRSHRRIALSAGAAVAALAAGAAFVMTSGAGASSSPFAAIPAVGNIGAMQSPALFAPPAQVQKLPPDLRPSVGATHQLGSAADAWLFDGGVCVVMIDNGPGGCFTQFTKPVTLYLWGDSTGFKAGGIAPDSVAGIELLTSGGDVPVTISGNSFEVSLPPNTAITGEQVTLSNGQTFINDDPVSLPHV